MDKQTVSAWLDRYIVAWQTYDGQAIGDLFSAGATCRYNPWEEPLRGREAIVASWLEEPDAPGTWQAHYDPVAVDGATAVARGRTRYFAKDGTTLEREYYNVFLLRFDAEGRCADFQEFYRQTPQK